MIFETTTQSSYIGTRNPKKSHAVQSGDINHPIKRTRGDIIADINVKNILSTSMILFCMLSKEDVFGAFLSAAFVAAYEVVSSNEIGACELLVNGIVTFPKNVPTHNKTRNNDVMIFLNIYVFSMNTPIQSHFCFFCK